MPSPDATNSCCIAINARRTETSTVELALACDLIVASEKARFGILLAQVGLAPNWLLAKKLMEVLGPVTTREMLLLGDPLPATRLHALGLIARCVRRISLRRRPRR